MGNYNSTAQVTVSVNGKQARDMLSALERDADKFKKKLEQAAAAGDKATMQKMQRELGNTTRLMNQLRGASATTEQVLKRLDSATPRELQKALRQLRQQLNGIERGSEAWDAQVKKIQAVKRELNSINSQMRETQTLGERCLGWFNKWQVALLGASASIASVVMGGRKAVNDYAAMEQEMANVRKYTGMSAEQVQQLNERMKEIDTRSGREQLNMLAQEAGRLGKTSPEDILGFVKAADKTNVALDDLGQGATLTLSKLTGIFGIENELGTEKALLSVGSVINELSQNSAASAPYLAEFASRLGGVGSQAGMTVQQIMAFGAVLDANNQNVEASSTALSQVIMRLFQEPAKYAQVAGLNVKQFSELVKTDINAALLQLLDTLNKAGKMDVLAPMFKDMGETGARAVAALSTLAGHIGEVKSQQQVANQAFREAVSIDKEFEVQNGTVMAQLEKAKNRFHEFSVELGEKLMPVMSHVISSGTLLVHMLSMIIDFVTKNRAALVLGASAWVVYKVAVKAAATETKIMMVLQGGYNVILKIGHIAVLAMSAAYNAMRGNALRAAAANRALSASMKSTPWGAIVAVIGMAVGAIVDYVNKLNEAAAQARARAKELQQLQKESSDYSSRAADAYSEEITRLRMLYDAAVSEAKSREQRIDAAKQLQSLYPAVFGNYTTEQIMLGQTRQAYENLAASIIKVAEAKAAAELLQENTKKILQLKMERDEYSRQRVSASAERDAIRRRNAANAAAASRSASSLTGAIALNGSGSGGQMHAMESTRAADMKIVAATKSMNELTDEINILSAANQKLTKAFEQNEAFQKELGIGGGTPAAVVPVPGVSGGGKSKGKASGSKGKEDKFAQEKAWRELAEAQAEISYRTGESDYIAYIDRMDEIAIEFYRKQLEHTDLAELERAKILSDYHEARAEQAKRWEERSIADEEMTYNTRLVELKQFYIDGRISLATYQRVSEQEELAHLRRMVELTREGSDERTAAEKQLLDKRFEMQQKARKEIEEAEGQHQQRLAQAREQLNSSAGTPSGGMTSMLSMHSELGWLMEAYRKEVELAQGNAEEKKRIDEAYAKARAEIFSRYGQDNPDMSGYEQAINKFNKWLESDGGKAMTGALSAGVSGMSSVFSQVTSMLQADLEIQTAAINKRYDAEIARAEGNSYKVAKLEKQKEAEIAKAKNEANRKMFVMQVIQAVAQTAQNALNAYGSAAAIPLVGHIIAPVAASMAIAAGMLQVAAIKKQQQASASQGYSEGGFTRPGAKDEPAGIVHAGEWVASQKLVNNPRVRPLLEALDYAQRTNTIGSITAVDVSRTITSPIAAAVTPQRGGSTVINNNYTQPAADSAGMTRAINRLNDRLERPFVTINTMTGEHGIKQVQDEYARLLRNKSRRSRYTRKTV